MLRTEGDVLRIHNATFVTLNTKKLNNSGNSSPGGSLHLNCAPMIDQGIFTIALNAGTKLLSRPPKRRQMRCSKTTTIHYDPGIPNIT